MRANRKQILQEINNVMKQVINKSKKVKTYYITSCGGELIQLTIYDEWDKYIDCTIGTPFEVLCTAKTWLYSLL